MLYINSFKTTNTLTFDDLSIVLHHAGVMVTLGLLTCQAATQSTTAPKQAAANVMALEGKYPDMDAAIKLVKNNEADLAAYLRDPETECTFFMPTSQVRHH